MVKVLINGEYEEIETELPEGYMELDYAFPEKKDINLEKTQEIKLPNLEETQEIDLGEINE